MIQKIVEDLVTSVRGGQAAIFIDGDGESIAHTGSTIVDLKLIGAWKEIHFDQIKEITERLSLGKVHAVLFSQDEGNVLVAPVAEEDCLMPFISSLADVREAMVNIERGTMQLKRDIDE